MNLAHHLDMALASLLPDPPMKKADNRTCYRCGAKKGECDHSPRWLR